MGQGGELIRVSKRELVIAVEDGAGRGDGDVIRVDNVAEDDIAFKMKTTNPNRYIVRPNVACIAKGASCDIRIFLAENAEEPAPGPSKDRFQLRVALAPGLSDDLGGVGEFWRENEDDANLLRVKFSVKFVPHVPMPKHSDAPLPPPELPAAADLLEPGRRDEAVQKAEHLEEQLQNRDTELARIRTELKETIAEKERTLRDAPVPPPAANRFFWDSYGGFGLLTVALIAFVCVLAVIFNRPLKEMSQP